MCKGSTADSDSVCEGSNPSPAASKKNTGSVMLSVFFLICGHRKSPTAEPWGSGCRKSRRLFSTACNNAVIFVPLRGTKIFASLHARLAAQGLARHSIRFEAGFAPSGSPRNAEGLHTPGDLSTSRSPTAEPWGFFCSDMRGITPRPRRPRQPDR